MRRPKLVAEQSGQQAEPGLARGGCDDSAAACSAVRLPATCTAVGLQVVPCTCAFVRVLREAVILSLLDEEYTM